MKASFHLLYGIIIGMLIIACTGSDSDVETESATNSARTTNSASNQENGASATNTATPTSSIADQKQFKEVQIVYHDISLLSGWNKRNEYLQNLRDLGWTIIDWHPNDGRDQYLVGR